MTLKKFVTGVGNAKKNEMLLKTYQAWGIEFNDDNAADAYGLAMMAGGLAKTKVQKDILLKLQDEKYRD
jgi:crossover junction endodeoxyribonuclease RuvC